MLNTTRPSLSRHRPERLPARYSLQAVNPATGKAIARLYSTIEAALDRGAALMDSGYCIEIWSPASLEKRRRALH
jgi:hypothetical protein